MNVVHLAEAPVPYDTRVLNYLNKYTELHVIYMSPGHSQFGFNDVWSDTPQFSYEIRSARSINLRRLDLWTQLSPGVSLRLGKLRPDVVLLKSWNLNAIEPLLWTKVTRNKCVMWSESTSFSGVFRGNASNRIRSVLLAQVDRFVSNGSMASRYLEDLGVLPSRILTSCLASPLADEAILSHAFLSASPSIAGSPRFLFVGRLIERKRPIELIKAFAKVIEFTPGAHLDVVGDGPLAEDVKREADLLGDSVSLLGRCEGEELAGVYLNNDILVVPSLREVWGLVVNEGLAHGLFVIATDEVSSAIDLVADSTCGTLVSAREPQALEQAMISAARDYRWDESARQHRVERTGRFTTEAFAKDVYQTIVSTRQ